MPYPQDPFALTVKTSFACPGCGQKRMIRETANQQAPYMSQVRCENCNHTTTYNVMKVAYLAASNNK